MAGERQAGWALAREALGVVARERGATDLRRAIGSLRFVDAGVRSSVYAATVALPAGAVELVVKLPLADAGPDRDEAVRREARLLRALGPLALPFRVPRAVAELAAVEGLVAIQERLAGVPIDLRAERSAAGPPWEVVAAVAAALHALDPAPFHAMLTGHATRREHAAAFARTLDRIDGPEGDAARAWVHAHLPPPAPARLLHGDLVGQNLLVSSDHARVAVIDWGEAMLGDPAFDLAVVTRGARRPFGREDGLVRLVDAYNRLASRPVTATEVRLHEIVLRGGLYLDVADELGPGSEAAANERRGLAAIVERSESTAG